MNALSRRAIERIVRAMFAIGTIVLGTSIAEAATFTIRPTDGAGEGLNDPTPFTPVGGNSATTLGEARMNVLQEAARIWGTLLQSSVPILVDAKFDPQTCSATSGTLGSAGPRSMFRNFSGAPNSEAYYVGALANALAGSRLASDPTSADIGATFNSSVDSDSACLGGRGFYYGLDHNRGTKVDLLLVVLHEFGHGLGFTSQVNLTTGAGTTSGGVERFDAFTWQIFDETQNMAWPDMTGPQRVTSSTNNGNVAWKGANVNAQIGRFAAGYTGNGRARLYAPSTVSSGSSISHFDTVFQSPDVLMEPNLSPNIKTSSTDITVCALQDIGWTVSICPHFSSNRPPTANAQSVTTLEDTPITITLTGSDLDNDPLTFAVSVQPTKGTLSSISATAPRTIVYTPNANANGTDSFTFTVSDGSATSSANVSVTITPVNDAPTVSDVSTTALSGQATAISIAGTDIDGDSLTYAVASNPAHGTVTITGPVATYKSNDGYVGADSFTYRANDGTTNSAAATVAISVQGTAQVTAPSSGGGGGGAVTPAWLLIIASLGVIRTLRRKT